MKKKNIIKIALDILMAIVFALLFNAKVITGLSFHEIAGLAIGLTFIIHKLINWRWIKQVTLNLFSKRIPIKTKLGYSVDVLLLITMVYIIVSGLLISKVLFPDFRYGSELFFKNTHISVAYISLLLLGIHVGLHWHWVMTMFKRLFRVEEKREIFNYIAKVAVILVLAVGIYSAYQTNYFSQVARIGTSFSQSQMTEQDSGFHKEITNENLPLDIKNNAPVIGDSPRRNHQKDFGGQHGDNSSSNLTTLNTLMSYLGIIALFTIMTYYVEKLLSVKMLKAHNKQ